MKRVALSLRHVVTPAAAPASGGLRGREPFGVLSRRAVLGAMVFAAFLLQPVVRKMLDGRCLLFPCVRQ